jgi:hypothetical protein
MNRWFQKSVVTAVWTIVYAIGVNACTSSNQAVDTTSTKRQLSGAELDSARVRSATKRGVPDEASLFLVKTRMFNGALVSPLSGDDQKLIPATGNQYGPRVWVFAADSLDDFEDETWFTQPRLVASLYISGGALAGDYNPLKLTTAGNYCVFLRHDSRASAEKGWSFLALNTKNVGLPSETVCKNFSPTTPLDGPVVTEQGAFGEAFDRKRDYPATVRFIEGKKAELFLGVPCGNRLCILGAKNQGDVNPPRHTKVSKSLVHNVRLWYDDQRLADLDNGNAAPSAFAATIIPDANLGNYSVEAFKDKSRRVAMIEVPNQVLPRYAAWGLVGGKNFLYIQLTSDEEGVAQITDPTGKVLRDNIRVIRDDDVSKIGGRLVPAAARWKWSDTDEQIWVRCDVGCCMVDPGDTKK